MPVTAACAFDEASDTASRLSLTAGIAAADSPARSPCMRSVRLDTVPSASLASAICSRARSSSPFDDSALAWASSVAATMAESDERASDTVRTASATFADAFVRDASTASRDSPSAWSIASAATSLTVETNVELMVSSRVLAPVSVIFGATGPVFSFT